MKLPGCDVVRVADVRMPAGVNLMVIRLDSGAVCAFLRASVEWCTQVVVAIRQAMAALPPLLTAVAF